MAKVEVFVHATNADVYARAMTLAPGTYLSRLTKKERFHKDLSIYLLWPNVHNFFPCPPSGFLSFKLISFILLFSF